MGRRMVMAAAMVAAACSGGTPGTFELSEDDAARAGSAYIAKVLDDDGDVLVLRDAAGAEVHRFAYGAAAD